ncbi:PEPxxWA-CTERM sorting domain-containing protein [Sandarakinorhabdus sp. AAP62]|uniref:PEPxxWA-CTERM sorting domain-containing protein n=1 Tax=Sandarakinorhabdus sp. AAP62 TaxID=1248916 RepID=UPI0002F71146|nr:PEPxxWA-CTERM sorting domain-containing protein [Sandarakinorhabdus sp. AAP62]
MKTMLKAALFALAATSALTGASAQTTVFGDRATFLSALSSSFTDGYGVADGYSGDFQILNNAAMTAVAGQTRYETTGFSNLNIIVGQRYCAGCNGSFTLHFDQTSFGNANGVGGVGLDITVNDGFLPYSALVTFGNSDTQLFALQANVASFWGLTSDRQIRSIAFGPNGGITTSGSFQIDNLTIGASGVVPEPASWAMLIAGFGLVGATARRRRAVTA